MKSETFITLAEEIEGMAHDVIAACQAKAHKHPDIAAEMAHNIGQFRTLLPLCAKAKEKVRNGDEIGEVGAANLEEAHQAAREHHRKIMAWHEGSD